MHTRTVETLRQPLIHRPAAERPETRIIRFKCRRNRRQPRMTFDLLDRRAQCIRPDLLRETRRRKAIRHRIKGRGDR